MAQSSRVQQTHTVICSISSIHKPHRRQNLAQETLLVSSIVRGENRADGGCIPRGRGGEACVVASGCAVVIVVAAFCTPVSPTATTDGDVAEGTATCPVSPAGFAEVTWLSEAVVVEVAELGVGGFASWTFQCGFWYSYVCLSCSIHYRCWADRATASATVRLRLRLRLQLRTKIMTAGC